MLRETTETPELEDLADRIATKRTYRGSVELRAILRRAIAGDWAPYEATLIAMGADYANQNFTGWHPLITAFSRRLIPYVVEAYSAEPARLAAALVAMQEFFDHVGDTLRTAYVAAMEAAVRLNAEALRESDETYRALFDASPNPLLVFDSETLRLLAVNDAGLRLYGYTREELLTMKLTDIKADKSDRELVARMGDPKSAWAGVKSHLKKDGSVVRVELNAGPMSFRGQPGRLVAVQDVTDRERLEGQLRQSQKMEAIGSLAGGVAHDFNNLLSVILSYSEVLAGDLTPGDPMRADLLEIHAAGMRAADLTRQLLAFSRRQVLQATTVSLNDAVRGVEGMLRRVIGEDIELTVIAAATPGAVTVDPGQLEQMIMNLAVNARDAMPRGGVLTIETSEVELDATYAAEHIGVTAGRHVLLTLTDTGEGMDHETQARMFEPFFTTKGVGKGTGLGLSTVFGIAQQSGATISVESELGKGTAFKLCFPSAVGELWAAPAIGSSSDMPRGSETILLVEDDERVRTLTRTILRKSGYEVLETRTAAEALLLCEASTPTIDLLLTDVVMPQVSGRELAERLLRLRPSMRVLFMSGYTDDTIMRHGILDSTLAFLQKPITPTALTRKVRDVLDANAQGSRLVARASTVGG